MPVVARLKRMEGVDKLNHASDRASTYSSVGGGVALFGAALLLGAAGSIPLITVGTVALAAGLSGVVVGFIRFSRAEHHRA